MTPTPQDLDRELIQRYAAIREPYPIWAKQVLPTIPCIGTRYGDGPRVLVYGSAENLANYDPVPVYGDRSPNRHRACFDDWLAEDLSVRAYFPRVHIAPVEKGGLFLAGLYALHRVGGQISEDRIAATEHLCWGNLQKFAEVKGTQPHETCSDLAEEYWALKESFPYIIADLQCLKPDLILLPRTSWDAIYPRRRSLAAHHSTLLTLLRGRAIPATQSNQRALNKFGGALKSKPARDRAAKVAHLFSEEPWAGWSKRVVEMSPAALTLLLGEVDVALEALGHPGL